MTLNMKNVDDMNLMNIVTEPPSQEVALGLPSMLNGCGPVPNESCDFIHVIILSRSFRQSFLTFSYPLLSDIKQSIQIFENIQL